MEEVKNYIKLIRVQEQKEHITLSKFALNDERLSHSAMCLLIWLVNYDEETEGKFYIQKAMKRFRWASKTSWKRKTKQLRDLGYMYYKKVYFPNSNAFEHIHLVTDDPKYLEDEDYREHLFELSIQPMRQETSIMRVNGKDYHKVEHPADIAADNEKANRQMRFQDPLTTPSYDHALGQWYVRHGWTTPRRQEEWEEARKPAMQAWARATRCDLGWDMAWLINQTFGDDPDEEEIRYIYWSRKARGWNGANLTEIGKDYWKRKEDPNHEPWVNSWEKKKISRTRSKSNGKQPANSDKSGRFHGLSDAEYNEEEFETIDITDEELGFDPDNPTAHYKGE